MTLLTNPTILTFVTHFDGLQSSGLESQIFEEYVRLSKKLPLLIITEKNSYNLQNENLKVSVVSQLNISKIRGIYKIVNYLIKTIKFKNDFDIVYIRTFSPPEIISSIFAKKILKKKILILIPGSWIFVGTGIKKKFFRYIYKQLLNLSDKSLIYSNNMIPELESIFGSIDKKKISTIKNAVDLERFTLIPNLELENIVLFIGRISPLKKIDDIINSIPHILKSVPDAKLEIIGNIESKEYYDQLKNLISKLNCNHSINFLGPIPNEKIVEYYQKCKVFAFMGMNEGIPRSILEAMSCGKAIVAAPNSGIPNAVIDGENGFLIKNSNPKILADKIILLLNDNELRTNFGINGRLIIKNEFNWEQFIESLYQNLSVISKNN